MLEQGVAEVETLLPSTTSTEELHEQTPSPATHAADLQHVTQQVEAAVAATEQTLSEVQQNPAASAPIRQN